MINLYLPKYCVLEIAIRENEEIPGEAKVYFGELAVLACKYNYVPYTDEELAKMKGKDVSTIKRWHTELEKYGFITRKTTSFPKNPGEGQIGGWTKSRKMFIHQTPKQKKDCPQEPPDSKSSYERLKNEPIDEQGTSFSEEPSRESPQDSKSSYERLKNEPIYISKNKTNKNETIAVVFSCLQKVEISQLEKERFSAKYPEHIVENAVRYLFLPTTTIRTSPERTLQWACDNPPKLQEPHIPEEARERVVKEILPHCRRLIGGERGFKRWNFELLAEGLEVSVMTTPRVEPDGRESGYLRMNPVVFSFSDKECWNKITSYIYANIPDLGRQMRSKEEPAQLQECSLGGV